MSGLLNHPLPRLLRLVAVAGLLGNPAAVRPADMLVTCTESALRSAIASSGGVTFACDGTITLGSPLIITNQVTLDAAGRDVALVAGGNHRLFHVEAGGDLVLIGLELRGGRDLGADGVDGAVDGQDGRPGERACGGAMLIEGGAVTIESCVLRDNLAEGGDGGAGYDASGCEAPGEGGHAGWGLGGAIYMVDGMLFLTGSTLRGNTARGGMGGAGGSAGACAFGSDGESGGAGGHGQGGAVYVENGLLEVESCSFFQNMAQSGGGGAGGAGAGGLGVGGDGGIGALARGGSVFANRGMVSLLGCTMAYESTVAGLGGAGGAGGSPSLDGDRGDHGIWQGECLYAARTGVMLSHCILDGARRLRNCGATLATLGAIADQGYNLSSDASCGLEAPGWNRTDPLLQSAAQIGPGTLALELSATSPAIDAGDPATAPPLDQFGTSRVGPPDLGALESILGAVTVNVTPLAAELLEGSTQSWAAICRTGPVERPQTVFFALSGSATLATDFAILTPDAGPEQLILPPGSDCVDLEVSALPDLLREDDEEVALTLLEGPYTIGSPDAATLLLRDHTLGPLLEGAWNTDRVFVVQFDLLTNLALSNITYTLESSSNLLLWTNVGVFVPGTNAMATNGTSTNMVPAHRGEIPDPDATNAPARFYRLRVE